MMHRFGQLFKNFIDEYGRDEVIKKLKIKLISNREFSEANNLVIKQIQKHLLSNKKRKSLNVLLKNMSLTATNLKAIENLKNASKN